MSVTIITILFCFIILHQLATFLSYDFLYMLYVYYYCVMCVCDCIPLCKAIHVQ